MSIERGEPVLIGKGSTTRCLDENDIRAVVVQGFQQVDVRDKRVLVIIPDTTRTAPVPAMFRAFCEALVDPSSAPRDRKVAALDFIVALGTHSPLNDEALNRLLGISAEARAGAHAGIRLFNHRWNDPAALVKLGTIPADEIGELTGGLFRQDLDVTVNRLILDYDLLVICGPTFPHEIVGFSGGNKYFFPGISGPEVINFTHWLGAVITSPVLIGTKYTPVRAVIDRAASMISQPRLCFSLVVRGSDLMGLYAGAPEETYAAAADLASQLDIVWVERPFRQVLSVLPKIYDDLWAGVKGMGKVEPAVADGGEVIIYAPHITEFSYVHGKNIEPIGFHCLDYFQKQKDRFKHVPAGLLSWSTHLRGLGTYDEATGVEHGRVTVTLATGIPRERVERLNLCYRDPATINLEEWAGREQEGILLVRRAGEMLYRVKR